MVIEYDPAKVIEYKRKLSGNQNSPLRRRLNSGFSNGKSSTREDLEEIVRALDLLSGSCTEFIGKMRSIKNDATGLRKAAAAKALNNLKEDLLRLYDLEEDLEAAMEIEDFSTPRKVEHVLKVEVDL